MKFISNNKFLVASAVALSIVSTLPAQTTAAPAPDVQQALSLRQGLVAAVIKNTSSASDVIAALQATTSPTGMHYKSSIADFSYAAIDVGLGLSVAGRPAEAVALFKAAETALAALVDQTPDADAYNKAQYLQSVALIRGRYLDEVKQGKLDIDRALQLLPNDSSLMALRAILSSGHADVYIAVTAN